jgi:long-subunit fatty acid transport protein
MRLRAAALLTVASVLASTALPQSAHAGGPEFPAGGTRSLGRGGAGFARADDPSLMFRNPALLADLWDDQAMLGAHFVLADSCMQATGAYGWNVSNPDVSDFGDGPVYLQAMQGDTDLHGKPLKGYGDDPFPKVCSQGAMPFLPQVGLSMKVAPNVGVGIGFFPPDNAALNQWGNRDGTIDTKDGKRPNPLRYFDSHLNTTFFSILSGIGWRPADWISIGAAFQWNMVQYSAITWTTALTSRDPRQDVRTDVYGRDLFVPAAIASIQLRPFDGLDIALGYKWSDRVEGNSKLDITTGVFGIGRVFDYLDSSGGMHSVGSTIPTLSSNQPAFVSAPPIWVPQATFSLRYADRLKPKPPDTPEGHVAAGAKVEDHMLNERWDIEADAVYYFTSVYDHTLVTSNSATTTLSSLDSLGNPGSFDASVGKCKTDPTTKQCLSTERTVDKLYKGKDQISLRFGGDYNLFPGIFALRAGVSYETDGQDAEWLNVMRYMFGRVGVHGGFTLRVADKTDVSFAWAHFIQKKVHLQVNDLHSGSKYPVQYRTAKYHFQPGEGVVDPSGMQADGKFDGVAGVETPNGAADRVEPGPDFVNAGSYYFNLDVASVTFTQHF